MTSLVKVLQRVNVILLRGRPALCSSTDLVQHSRREIHTTSPDDAGRRVARFHEYDTKGDYADEERDKKALEYNMKKWFGLKDGFKDIRVELTKWKGEVKERFTDDSWLVFNPGDRDYVFTFDSPAFMETWDCVADSDHGEGFSKCQLSMSPTGKGLFQGYINTRVPKDGRIKKSGYCGMRCKRITKSFRRDTYYDWSGYTHVVMRVRGDGRKYHLNLAVAGSFDLNWNDVFSYILYTRGGPYWQYVKIPFSKFFLSSKGRVQDYQVRMPTNAVSSVGLTVSKIEGPFNLEIDYIGVELDPKFDEDFAYETYKTPVGIGDV